MLENKLLAQAHNIISWSRRMRWDDDGGGSRPTCTYFCYSTATAWAAKKFSATTKNGMKPKQMSFKKPNKGVEQIKAAILEKFEAANALQLKKSRKSRNAARRSIGGGKKKKKKESAGVAKPIQNKNIDKIVKLAGIAISNAGIVGEKIVEDEMRRLLFELDVRKICSCGKKQNCNCRRRKAWMQGKDDGESIPAKSTEELCDFQALCEYKRLTEDGGTAFRPRELMARRESTSFKIFSMVSNSKYQKMRKEVGIPLVSVRTLQRRIKDMNLKVGHFNAHGLCRLVFCLISRVHQYLSGGKGSKIFVKAKKQQSSGSESNSTSNDDDGNGDAFGYEDWTTESLETLFDKFDDADMTMEMSLSLVGKFYHKFVKPWKEKTCISKMIGMDTLDHLLGLCLQFDEAYVKQNMVVSTRTSNVLGVTKSFGTSKECNLFEESTSEPCSVYEAFILRPMYTRLTSICLLIPKSKCEGHSSRANAILDIISLANVCLGSNAVRCMSKDNAAGNTSTTDWINNVGHAPIEVPADLLQAIKRGVRKGHHARMESYNARVRDFENATKNYEQLEIKVRNNWKQFKRKQTVFKKEMRVYNQKMLLSRQRPLEALYGPVVPPPHKPEKPSITLQALKKIKETKPKAPISQDEMTAAISRVICSYVVATPLGVTYDFKCSAHSIKAHKNFLDTPMLDTDNETFVPKSVAKFGYAVKKNMIATGKDDPCPKLRGADWQDCPVR